MKRYIRCMGVHSPAHVVPSHNTYGSSIKESIFKDLIRDATAANNATLVDGLILQIIADINADNAAGNVPNQDIRNYYRRYYNMVSSCNIASSNLVVQLNNLT